jgi:hypothetical protein
MKRAILSGAFFLALGISLQAQKASGHYDWIEWGKISHGNGKATFSCNHPDAMLEAIRTVREEYGWNVSVEIPSFFSSYDLVDDTAVEWRNAHPGAKGVKRTAGGRFSSTFDDPAQNIDTALEESVLNRIVSDYNSSGNPGQYRLVKLKDGVFDVVGASVRNEEGSEVPTESLLDTLVTLPSQNRTLYDTVNLILDEASKKLGKRAIMVWVPVNVFRNVEVTVGGKNVSARDLLLQAFSSTPRSLMWDVGYDSRPDPKVYLFSSSVAMKVETGRTGVRVPVPVNAAPQH